MGAEPSNLDLTPLSARYRRERSRYRLLGATIGGGLAVLWAALLALEFQSHAAPAAFTEATAASAEAWVVFAGLALAVGVIGWGCFALGASGASRIRVDAVGVQFTWRSGRVTTLRWENPRFRLDLWVVPKVANSPEDLQVVARAKVSFHGPTDLSEQAFQNILEGASAHGLSITKRKWHGLFPSDPVSTLRIRARGSSGSG